VVNHAGPDLTWEALFRGAHPVVHVDGVAMTARTKTLNGATVSGVTLTLGAGQRRTATVDAVAGGRPQNQQTPRELNTP
jgi:hypothetical protein